ncbi:MAG TPA: TMEM165/GDT1 family protein [Coriobacteriia bacterium]|nr:TMEM165/GDT1 family protein [Coriobacteriia bacterium]
MTYIFLVALILIMVGELADKSQLLALLLATRYKAWQVLIGIFIATFIVHFFTTLAGQFLGAAIPPGVIPWITGLLFIGFGIWTLRGDSVEDSEAEKGNRFGPILATTIAFFLAELGDKTQIMTLAIAVDPGSALLVYLRSAGPTVQQWLLGVGSPENVGAMGRFWAVTLGSTTGMVIADAIAIGIGRLVGKRMPELLMRQISGVIFILFGLLSIGTVLLGK